MSKAKPHLTYAKSGVDIKKIKQSHKKIANMLRKTFSYRRGLTGEVSIEIGHYAGLLKLDKDKMLALHADGVGTKTLIATAMKKYDTIGIDCVAMNVNDLICIGAEPIAMVDYLAINKPEEDVIKDIMKGLAYGAKQARVSIVGGETAVMPDLINGFDLAAMSVGILNKDQLITGEKIEAGDKIYGLKSSGIHSNGLTLARKVLLSYHKLTYKPAGWNRTLGEELLIPTRIYVNIVDAIIRNCEVHGLAHITGGAFTKLMRLSCNLGFMINTIPNPPPIFALIQKLGRISDYEMYRTFNMGIGFCVIAPRRERDTLMEIAKRYYCGCIEIGEVTEDVGVTVNNIRIA